MRRFHDQSNISNRRAARGPVALSTLLPKIAGPAFRRRGFAEAAILAEWREIVGETLAACTAPIKLALPRGQAALGTLHVKVAGPFATELQHLAPQVIERINGFFGYAAVSRLALIQGPVSPYSSKPRRGRSPPVPAGGDGSDDGPRAIEDEDLRRALGRLGRAVRDAGSR